MNKLGQGLAALIPDEDNSVRKSIKIEELCPGTFQHRKAFDDEALYELSNSIKSNGVIQPIIVRKKNNSDKYEIIAGERRTRASKYIGLSSIPAIVIDVNDKKALEISIIENIQREDLNVIEESSGYKNLIDEFGYSHEQVGQFIGKSRSHVANCLRILTLPDEIQSLVKNKSLSMGHARALINVKNTDSIVNKILKNSLSVRQTEDLVKKLSNSVERSKKKKDKNIVLLEEQISKRLGLGVTINDSKDVGSVVVNFKNLHELNFILKKLSSESKQQEKLDSVNLKEEQL